MKLFQPPMNSNIHSLRIPMLTGPLPETISMAAPQTGASSDARRLPDDSGEEVQTVNLVLVYGHKEKRSEIESNALRVGMRLARIRHVLSLAASKPNLYEDLTPRKQNCLPLVAIIATERLILDGVSRVPVLWFWGDYNDPKKAPSRSLGLFQDYKEEYWDHYYWFAFVAK